MSATRSLQLEPKFSYGTPSQAPIGEVKGVEFTPFNLALLQGHSVCEINNTVPISGFPPLPTQGGLLDPRLGVTDAFQQCVTCRNKALDCPGHWGIMKLTAPVFNWGYIDAITKILCCVCHQCGRLRVPPADPQFRANLLLAKPNARLRKMVDLMKGKTKCEFRREADNSTTMCGAALPKVWRPRDAKNVFTVRRKFKSADDVEHDEQMTAAMALDVFRMMSTEDIAALGFAPSADPTEGVRPEDFILQAIPVPPLHVRPAVQAGTMRMDDDLTNFLQPMLKYNTLIKTHRAHQRSQEEMANLNLLQYFAALYINNQSTGNRPPAVNNQKRPLTSLSQRLKGKQGRVRQNLMGKRVDFSARSVITADPNLHLQEVGVPLAVAQTLTFPERVTKANMARLQRAVRRGPATYPGATYLVQSDGTRIDLSVNHGMCLQEGQQVERHVVTGDPVLFNRQPTLHRASMMGHRARVLRHNTFRLNLSVTTPYNADFDGDEMNLHVPQSYLTRTELLMMMMVPRNIVSTGGMCSMGLTQDSLLSTYRITQRDTFIDELLFNNIMMCVKSWTALPVPAILAPKVLWTGKQAFSLICPEMTRSTLGVHSPHARLMNPSDTEVVLRKGQLLSGVLFKEHLGSKSSNGLVHHVFLDFGHNEAAEFLTDIQKVVDHWMLNNGFTIGISDTIADDNTMVKVKDKIEDALKEVEKIKESARLGDLPRQVGMTYPQSFEKNINDVLAAARDDAGLAVQNSLPHRNSFKMMIASGSKGTTQQICQVIACVGQQQCLGRRVPMVFTNRTLPHFTQFDNGPEACGFVRNSFLRGLCPNEFFFHCISGREGLIDTACKTAETGYIQRQFVKCMEDLVVRPDGSVRDNVDFLVQSFYGDDCIDPLRTEAVDIPVYQMTRAKFEEEYRYEVDGVFSASVDFGGDYLDPDVAEKFTSDEGPILLRALKEEYETLSRYRKLLQTHEDGFGRMLVSKRWFMPANLTRIIRQAQTEFKIGPENMYKGQSDLCPVYVATAVNDLVERLVRFLPGGNIDRSREAIMLFETYLRSFLHSRRVIKDFRLDRTSFNVIIGRIEERYKNAIIQSGEAVGTICGQSMGEPATQMTLNTFHFAGIGSKNVTLGVPRLRELLSLSRHPKTPSLTVGIHPKFETSKYVANIVRRNMQFMPLKSLIRSAETWFDPFVHDTVIPPDAYIVDINASMPTGKLDDPNANADDVENLSPYVIRLNMSDEYSLLLTEGVSLKHISNAIHENHPDLYIETSGDGVKNARIRIRRRNAPRSRDDGEDDVEDDEDVLTANRILIDAILSEVVLRGVRKIKRAYIQKKDQNERYNPESESFVKIDEVWSIVTDGSNLQDAMMCPLVDTSNITSNSVGECFDVLGIEATRAELMLMIHGVYQAYGMYINYHHQSLLVDQITHKGVLLAISRSGMKHESGPLMRCSFEQTVEILFQASMFGTVDDANGVSASIMLGKTASIGTGSFDILIDHAALPARTIEEQATGESLKNIEMVNTPGVMAFTPGIGGATPGLGVATPGLIAGNWEFTPDISREMAESAAQTPYMSNFTPMTGFRSAASAYDPSSSGEVRMSMYGAPRSATDRGYSAGRSGAGSSRMYSVGSATYRKHSNEGDGLYTPQSGISTNYGAPTGAGASSAGVSDYSPSSARERFAPASAGPGSGRRRMTVGSGRSGNYTMRSSFGPLSARAAGDYTAQRGSSRGQYTMGSAHMPLRDMSYSAQGGDSAGYSPT